MTKDTATSEDTAEDDTEDNGDAYLVEPLHATSVVNKFTGTFGASHDTDKLTSTILALNHFVIEDTACLLAFAQYTYLGPDNQLFIYLANFHLTILTIPSDFLSDNVAGVGSEQIFNLN
ncbi:hypothetical protein B0H19DRAFT_1058662 [Mycena capillaripes]|nr:hypothetical protein B0H19DRAFT_1058662 [Mycena capillaripes]